MSSTPLHEPEAQVLNGQPQPEQGQGGGQGGEVVPSGSVASRPPQPHSDPQASRRVCFYKSGDPQFGGHRMVINARTFKTFDALLDALSKKVPLPFGVRTITTPRGSHPVRGLEELQDGGSYVCSDQRKVKPLNLDMANRRQPPWNTTTRPVSAGRRAQRGSRGVPGAINRPADSRVRTPKRLIVFKNRDPSVRRTVVLQRRTAPTYDALLDHLSVVMQFPVLKLYTPDGSRVEGLPALILCSGVVVASGNEPFRPGNYDFLRPTQPAAAQSSNSDSIEPTRLQPLTENKTSLSSGRRSRNFSLSSERYFVNQINKSVNGSSYGQPVRLPENTETELNQRKTRGSVDLETETYQLVEDNGKTSIVPQDDDIEKSFRVNQDGSMTVEMKVRLTIKEEEMIHWTTTLSRSSMVTNHKPGAKLGSTPQSPDNNVEAKDPNIGLSEDETKESNHPSRNAERDVAFSGTDVGGTDSGGGGRAGSLKAHPRQKRMPTPGLRQVKKKQASVESVTTVTETGVQETSLGTFSYTERMADGETTGGYCVVRKSSSSSRLPAIPPVPKPRKSGSAGASRAIRTSSHSSLRSSGVAEVMQIQNNGNGREITETVMHIYERRQSSYDNYYANALGPGYGTGGEGGGGNASEAGYGGGCGGGSNPMPRSKPASSDSGPCSSVDLTRSSSTSDSLNQQRDEILSLSSEPTSPSQNVTLPFQKLPDTISNKLSSFPDNEAHAASESHTGSSPKTVAKEEEEVEEDALEENNKKRTVKRKGKQMSPTSTTSSKSRQKDSVAGSVRSTKNTFSPASTEKKSGSATGSEKVRSATESDSQVSQRSREKVEKNINYIPVKNGPLALNIDLKDSKKRGLASEKQLNMGEKVGRGQRSQKVNTTKSSRQKTQPRKNMFYVSPARQTDIGQTDIHTDTGQTDRQTDNKQIVRQTGRKMASQPTRKTLAKQRSMSNEDRTKSPKQILLSESFSMPVLHPPLAPSGIHQYVENWLQNIAPESIPYEEGQDTGEAEPRTKVIFQIGADSDVESEVKSGYPEDQHLPQGGDHLSVGGMSMSCLSVPVSHAEAQVDLSNPQWTRKLCSSMPSVRIDPVEQQSRLGLLHRSSSFVPRPVEHSESSSSIHHLLIPKATLTPILRQLCSSIQCIRQASQPPASLEKSHSMPDFSSQVASVFGTSSKALMSFLSVTTLKDTLSSALGKGGGGGEFCGGNSNSGSEALLVMQSLQKISTMEDEEQQRASLASLQSRTSDQLKDSWRDFQEMSSEMGDRESPPLSPSTNQEFALDVVSEAGDENGERLDIEELMEELNMPQELRDEVSSLVEGERTVQYAMRSPMLGGSDSDMSYAVDTEVDKIESGEVEELEVFEEDVKKIPDNWPEASQPRPSAEEEEEEGKQEGEEDEEEQKEEEEVQEETEGEGLVAREIRDVPETEATAIHSEEVNTAAYRTQDVNTAIESGMRESKLMKSNEEVEDEEVDDEKEEGEERSGDEKRGGEDEEWEVKERAINLCGVKDQGLDTSNELKTDEGEEEEDEEEEVRGKDCSHPVEISQELLDFVNTALKSSSLMFTYDPKGNLRIEPEGATRVVHTKQMVIFNGCVDSQYGLKRLPSPNTSDLSDYRPETSSSGGYKTQGSVDMSTESGDEDKEEAGRHSPGFRRIRQTSDKQSKAGTTSLELWASKPSSEMKADQLRSPESLEGKRPTESFESCDSGAKVCGESLSYVSGSSSVKTEPGPELVRMIDQGRWLFKEGDSPEGVGGAWQSAADSKSLPDSSEGVLIDQGRWLLKENHLIRKSPPVPMGMYGNLDNTSVDTTLSEEAPAYDHHSSHHSSSSLHHHHHLNPLSVLSSSELEELARPLTPKCTYYNMSHSSDSDPFLDDLSLNGNGARERSEGRDQGLQGRSKRETAVDTSRTWARKNGSMSSFISVEFRMRDGRVHPEAGHPEAGHPEAGLGGSEAAVEQSSRTAVGMSGRSRVMQVQSSLQSLRCGPCTLIGLYIRKSLLSVTPPIGPDRIQLLLSLSLIKVIPTSCKDSPCKPLRAARNDYVYTHTYKSLPHFVRRKTIEMTQFDPARVAGVI
ncbi:oxygen-regulated protein 1-like [Salvelinus sp. IW2-2015]|uniref:oxygen-regulated protein 1-like n=1 Tax=Salvelinus sp. IW2-2015 TaxID=2691554 RepID=UPI0038D3C62E